MSDQPVVLSLQTNFESKEAVEFFRRLGMCVAGWAFMDRRLYQIFHHASGFEATQSAFIFYRNRAFTARLRLVDDATRMFLTEDQYEDEWRPLHEEADELSHTRNIFAHHPALRKGTSKDGQPFDIFSIHIEPYERILNRDYPGLRDKEALEVADLIDHEAAVDKLESQLHNFAWRVGGFRADAKARNQNYLT